MVSEERANQRQRYRHYARTVFVLVALLIMLFPVFWFVGGIQWLDKKVFPPRRPKFMPAASIWIDAPSLPISWHHGWWFGCAPSSSETSDYCRLVTANGEQVYAGEYLLCSSSAVVPEREIHLIPPNDSSDMWLFAEGHEGVGGFLENGDLLVPKSLLNSCTKIKDRKSR
jgi:hypothetical protein